MKVRCHWCVSSRGSRAALGLFGSPARGRQAGSRARFHGDPPVLGEAPAPSLESALLDPLHVAWQPVLPRIPPQLPKARKHRGARPLPAPSRMLRQETRCKHSSAVPHPAPPTGNRKLLLALPCITHQQTGKQRVCYPQSSPKTFTQTLAPCRCWAGPAHTQAPCKDALCSRPSARIWADAGLGAVANNGCANRSAVPAGGSWEQKSKGRKRLGF